MGDFEVAVDVETTLDDAPRRASTVVEWLTADGIIDATPTDDRDVWGPGYYRPGPQLGLTRSDGRGRCGVTLPDVVLVAG